MAKVIEIALGLVCREDGSWLVSRRAGGRIYAGCWEFPGGRMEPGESAMAAAIRETREETGLAVEAVGSLGEVTTRHSGKEVVLHLVHCRPAGGEASPRDPAVLEVRWLQPAELDTLAMPPANAEIVARILALGSQ